MERPQSVHGFTEAIEGSSEEPLSDRDLHAAARTVYERTRADALEFTKGHEQGSVTAEADDFGRDFVVLEGLNVAEITHSSVWPVGFDDQAHDINDFSTRLKGWHLLDRPSHFVECHAQADSP